MGIDRTHILVLNYDGLALLQECLPSVLGAAEVAGATVGVVDNGSTDGSLEYLSTRHPEVRVSRRPNRGMASFNDVLGQIDAPIALLLNNDVKLDPGAVGPLVDALRSHPDALFAAPRCWAFDGKTYEGMRTRVKMRRGLVDGRCRVPGHEDAAGRADLTASAGPVLAVDRRKFLEVGGYDPVYFPGRIEDLDLGFRGWMAGYRGYYVPESIAHHRGFGSFGPAFGARGCDRLAARNTLLFAWKNLAGGRLAAHLAWLVIRLIHAALTARWGFLQAFAGALSRLSTATSRRRDAAVGGPGWVDRQEAYFERFAW